MNQDLAVFITPAALILGCALFTGAGLYTIDIHSLRSRTQPISSLVAGSLILGVLEIILAGSSVSFFKAQQVQTSECELAGESAHPETRRLPSQRASRPLTRAFSTSKLSLAQRDNS